jgi:hypothetical protein
VFVFITSTTMPTKIFKSKEKASEWILEMND